MTIDYLIIGTGIAAMSAAKEIRKGDEQGEIVMVSNEKELPYYRFQLTKAIAKDASKEDLALEDPSYYEDHNIEVKLETQVEEIDYENKVVKTDKGDLEYDKLLLATGSNPFVPDYEGGPLENVFTMRTMEDYLQVQESLKDDQLQTILVVGGGLLGLEAAYAFLEKGFEVHVGEFSDYLLGKQLDQESSVHLKEKLEEEGLIIHTGSTLKEVQGDGKVEKVLMTGGEEFDCQLVLFSVGVRSETSLASGPVESNRGLIANQHLETGAEDVWTAGDCAEVDGTTMGLWTASKEMGEIAGKNMVGGDASYSKPKLFTNLRIGDIRLYSAGSHDGDEVFEQRDGDNFVKIFFQDGKTIGGILGGNISKMGDVNDLIEKGANKEEAEQVFA